MPSAPAHPMPDSVVCLLGMHRSGTSCLSGSLQRAGLFLGKYHTWNHHNHAGNRENQDIVTLNETILKANGGDWDRPPTRVDWREEHRWRAIEILEMYSEASIWGFKDPRTLLTLDGWLGLVPDMRCVGIFRHPVAVMESLHSRGGFPRHMGLFLWEYYNRILLQHWQEKPFPILCFDWDEETFHEHLDPILTWLGIGPLAREDRFFTPTLRSKDRQWQQELPPSIERLYGTLKDIAATPWQSPADAASPEHYAVSDKIDFSKLPLNDKGKPMVPNSPTPVNFFEQSMPFLNATETDQAFTPVLSLIVIIYKMREQALKTLRSLSIPYQQGVTHNDYEVLVVENASTSNLEEHEVIAFGPNFRYIRRQEPSPSPVPSVNYAATQARGSVIGLIIDGARMATPGLIHWTLIGSKLHPDAIVATPGYHLGPKLQQEAILEGYNNAAEQKLLDSIEWPKNGYRLFEIAVLSGTSATGVFKPIGESNCLSVPKHIWEKLGGCDPRFVETGGGQVNLDLYKRACELPETKLIMLPGEGTFHQLHGGITTGTQGNNRLQIMADHFAEYTRIRGKPYSPPIKRAIYLGPIADCAQKFIQQSAIRVRQLRGELPDPRNKKASQQNSKKPEA